MNFEQLIKERFSVRKFNSDLQVSDDNLTKILEAGRLAPTAKNFQPQKIYVVRGEENLAKMDLCTRCRYGAPTVLIICSDKEIVWKENEDNSVVMDATIVATHMMLEATNIGVDNIWIKLFDKDMIRKEFNIPDKYEIVSLLPLGYRQEGVVPSRLHDDRKTLSETVEYL